MEVAVAYDLRSEFSLAPEDPEDLLEEYDSPETIDAIELALRANGATTTRLSGGEAMLRALLGHRPDLVFNFTEGWGTRSREAHVPAVLELLGIPFTDSDPLTMAVTLEKAVAKSLVAAGGVPTPAWQVVEQAGVGLGLELPVVAKPLREGSSIGIRSTSILRDLSSVQAHIVALLESYRQPVLLEEFCPGPELSVGILGNGRQAEPLGALQVVPKTRPLEEFVYSLDVKRNYVQEVEYRVPPDLPSALVRRALDLALDAYRILGCRDVARIDLRVDRRGEPSFLEANPMPGLHPEKSDLVILGRENGLDYNGLVGRILSSARARHGI